VKLRTLALAVLAPLALIGAGLAWTYSQAEGEYDHVVSIRTEHSFQDPALLEQAWALPVAAAYRDDGYEYQANPSFCGPTSAANLLQSQGIATDQNAVLDGTEIRPVFGILPAGLTLDQEADLLRAATGQTVTVMRDLDLAAFRAELAHANDPTRRYIVNFHRGPLFAAGHGHFSPILGYLAEADLVFVGDVNEDFRPFLVPSARLFEAMNTIDTFNDKKRGLLRVDASVTASP
jgi:hypothetical protein